MPEIVEPEPEPEILYHDEHLLIVDKPPGLPTTAPGPNDASLTRWVERRLTVSPHPTSRLDAPVSGVVTLALTRTANRRLLQARREGSYERVYLGVTLEDLEPAQGAWDWPISLDPRNAKLRIAGTGRAQREARTCYEVAARTDHASLLRLRPRTGRTHQLRVHAARAGAALFGDYAYGGPRRKTLPDGRVVTARRVMLHCVRVSFPWPHGEPRRFEAPVPADMQRVWAALGGAPLDLA